MARSTREQYERAYRMLDWLRSTGMLVHMPNQPRRHHFIPRLLLRGFASRVSGDKCFVYQFRAGADPREVSIADVGVERDFHGETGEIETLLSAKESRYAPLVRDLREGNLRLDDKALIVDFVLNLSVRTRNVRTGLADVGRTILGQFDTHIQVPRNRDALERELRDETIQRTAEKLLGTKKIRKKLKKRFGSKSHEVADLARQALDALPFGPMQVLEYAMREAQSRVDFEAIARDAQLKALRDDSGLFRRRKDLEVLQWSLLERPAGTFVLGDLGPVALSGEGWRLVNPIDPEPIVAIYLPVSSRRLLCGQVDGHQEEPDSEVLNRAAVELSRDLFIADRSTPREMAYLTALGRRSKLFERMTHDTESFENALIRVRPSQSPSDLCDSNNQ